MAKAKWGRRNLKLKLTPTEAWTIREILYVTQMGLQGRGAVASGISRALDNVELDPNKHRFYDRAQRKTISLSEALDKGLVIRKESVDTGVYWVDTPGTLK